MANDTQKPVSSENCGNSLIPILRRRFLRRLTLKRRFTVQLPTNLITAKKLQLSERTIGRVACIQQKFPGVLQSMK